MQPIPQPAGTPPPAKRSYGLNAYAVVTAQEQTEIDDCVLNNRYGDLQNIINSINSRPQANQDRPVLAPANLEELDRKIQRDAAEFQRKFNVGPDATDEVRFAAAMLGVLQGEADVKSTTTDCEETDEDKAKAADKRKDPTTFDKIKQTVDDKMQQDPAEQCPEYYSTGRCSKDLGTCPFTHIETNQQARSSGNAAPKTPDRVPSTATGRSEGDHSESAGAAHGPRTPMLTAGVYPVELVDLEAPIKFDLVVRNKEDPSKNFVHPHPQGIGMSHWFVTPVHDQEGYCKGTLKGKRGGTKGEGRTYTKSNYQVKRKFEGQTLPDCTKWRKNICHYGDTCAYKHDEPGEFGFKRWGLDMPAKAIWLANHVDDTPGHSKRFLSKEYMTKEELTSAKRQKTDDTREDRGKDKDHGKGDSKDKGKGYPKDKSKGHGYGKGSCQGY